MSIYRVQHSFQHINGLSDDQFVNTFYFQRVAADEAAFGAISDIVRSFYASDPTGPSGPVKSIMSGIADGPGARVKIFDMADSIPRPLKHSVTYTPASISPTGGNLPSELAICLSYAAAPAAGVPVASRRGRMYIGPLAASTISSVGGSDEPMVSTDAQQIIVDNAVAMAAAALGNGWVWCLHSPTSGLDNPIVRVWCDNAFDIQRRRGIKPSARTSATL